MITNAPHPISIDRDKLNIKLHSILAYRSSKLSDEEFEETKLLLEKGADPNYIKNTEIDFTFVESAVFHKDLRLLKLLKQFHANMELTSHSSLYMKLQHDSGYYNLTDEKEKVEWCLINKHLPIQSIAQNIKLNYFDPELKEIYQLFFETEYITSIKNEIYEKVNSLYHSLKLKIEFELEQAQGKNKRLMILVGENHESINSAIIEAMIITICAHHYDIKTVLHEDNMDINERLSVNGKVLINNNFLGPSEDNAWYMINSLHPLMKTLEVKSVSVDQGKSSVEFSTYDKLRSQELFYSSTSKEGIQLRDRVMSEITINHTTGNVIMRVGGAHVFGVLKEISHLNNFHVLPINATGRDIEDYQSFVKDSKENYVTELIKFLVTDSSIFQAKVVSLIQDTLFTPNVAIDLVDQAHRAATESKSNKMESLTSSFHSARVPAQKLPQPPCVLLSNSLLNSPQQVTTDIQVAHESYTQQSSKKIKNRHKE